MSRVSAENVEGFYMLDVIETRFTLFFRRGRLSGTHNSGVTGEIAAFEGEYDTVTRHTTTEYETTNRSAKRHVRLDAQVHTFRLRRRQKHTSTSDQPPQDRQRLVLL